MQCDDRNDPKMLLHILSTSRGFPLPTSIIKQNLENSFSSSCSFDSLQKLSLLAQPPRLYFSSSYDSKFNIQCNDSIVPRHNYISET